MNKSKPKVQVKPKKTDKLFKPFKDFLELESAGGLMLIIATVIALLLANMTGFSHEYFHFWEKEVGFTFGSFHLEKHLIHWINDGLMAIFFFVVGLEIKREIMVGELSSMQKASLPIAAAIGGMVVPAMIFALLNLGGDELSGWGIPMATDIAFALGILALLGSRVPTSLKVFLTALAIIDDIGAVLVIAVFYTSEIHTTALIWASVIIALLFIANRLEIRQPSVYAVLGIFLWFAVLKSGLHATIAGVVAAFAVPARSRVDAHDYVIQARAILNFMERHFITRIKYNPDKKLPFATEQQIGGLHAIKELSEQLDTPLQRMEHDLHTWTTYVIIPIFALANAGVAISLDGDLMTSSVTMGVFFGLLVGKMAGVFLACKLSVKLGWAQLPSGVTWKHLFGAGCLAGIGFTMSLFITNLAYSDAAFIQMSKLGILAASLVSGIIGYLVLKSIPKQTVT